MHYLAGMDIIQRFKKIIKNKFIISDVSYLKYLTN